MADSFVEALTPDGLKAALREARQAAAAHREALRQVSDAQSLRLTVLADDVKRYFADLPEAAKVFDIALGDGTPPRLWLDAITSVIMAPDPHIYRLQEDQPGGLAVLLESSDRSAILNALKGVFAHRLVERQRAATAPLPPIVPRRASAAPVVVAWLVGALCGALGLWAVLLQLNLH